MNKGLRGILPYPVKDLLHRRLPLLLVIYALFSGAPVTAQARDSNGYRSAHFGMTEAAVLDAIEADFAIPPGSVERSANALEKTANLTVTVIDLVEFTGAAEIVYIFGYQSKKLIQINLLWRAPAGANDAEQRLQRAARIMANRVSLWGISKFETAPDTVTSDGATLLFQGRGESGMIASISMSVPCEELASCSASETADDGCWLRVALIENVDAPDVYKIQPGQF